MKKFIIFVAAFAMVGAFVATAVADVSLYGSARFRTYYLSSDPGPASETDSDLEWRLGTLSRFGAKFKSDKITGMVEIDARAAQGKTNPNNFLTSFGSQSVEAGTGASSIGNVRLRHLWGQYDFGSWKFMIGQNYPLYDAPISSINYYAGGFQPYGGIGYGVARTSQVRFTMGNFRLALLPTDTSTAQGLISYNTTDPVTGDPVYPPVPDPENTLQDSDVKLPKIELRYDFKFDQGALNLIGGFQTFDVKGFNDNIAYDESVTSWVLGARGKWNFGPAYVGASLTYRVNGANYGAWSAIAGTETPTFTESGSLEDATAWGGVAVLGWKLNDSNTLEASYGYLTAEQDTPLDNEDDTSAIGLMWKYTVAPGFYIIPEFIFQDNKDKTVNGVTTEQGDNTIFGVFWRIDFK